MASTAQARRGSCSPRSSCSRLLLPDGRQRAQRVEARRRVRRRESAAGPSSAFLYLGAKHMVTGYDHLLFLVGVIFFLYRLKDVVLYVSLFTIGHSVDAAPGRPRRHPRQPLHHRRDHRLLGRLQGVRQHGRLQARVRLPAEHEDRRADLRPVPRLRSGDEAAGVRALAERPGRQHRELQRRRRNRAGAGAHGRVHRPELLAHARRDFCGTRSSRTRC